MKKYNSNCNDGSKDNSNNKRTGQVQQVPPVPSTLPPRLPASVYAFQRQAASVSSREHVLRIIDTVLELIDYDDEPSLLQVDPGRSIRRGGSVSANYNSLLHSRNRSLGRNLHDESKQWKQ